MTRIISLNVSFVAMLMIPSAIMAQSLANLGWEARSHRGGPGNGCWDDSPEAVRVDDDGLIHLRLARVDGKWCQAEIRSMEIATYGRHRFQVISRLDQLHPAVVLGLFLYRDDAHEIDIEISRAFGGEHDVGLYTVQPATPKRTHSFPIELTGDYTTHEIEWLPDLVRFSSWHGHCDAGPCGGWIERWEYCGSGVPSESDRLVVMMNLWLKKNRELDEAQEARLRYEKIEN